MSKNLMLGVLALAGDKGATGLSATADASKAASSGLCDRDFSMFVDTRAAMPARGRAAGVIGPLLAVAESVLRAIAAGQPCPVPGPSSPTGTGDAIASLWETLPHGEGLPCHVKGKKTDAQRDAMRPFADDFAAVFSALVTEGVKALAESASVKSKAGKASRDEKKATDAAAVAAAAAAEKADIIGGAVRSAGAVDLVRALGMFDPEAIGAAAGADVEAFDCLLSLLNGVASQRAAAAAAAEAAIVAAADAAMAAAAAAQQSILDCAVAGSFDGARAVGDQYVTVSIPGKKARKGRAVSA